MSVFVKDLLKIFVLLKIFDSNHTGAMFLVGWGCFCLFWNNRHPWLVLQGFCVLKEFEVKSQTIPSVVKSIKW